MYTTIEQVKSITGYDVTNETIAMAQYIIESYTGRVEPSVEDAEDLMLLGRATAFQAAYQKDNDIMVYEQMNVFQTSMFGNSMMFQQGNTTSPWVSPLAMLACHRLSWMRPRSIKTGSLYGRPQRNNDWVTD